MRFSQTLKLLREQHGFTQIGLAEKLLISQGHLARLENEVKEPSAKLILRIAKTFSVSTDELLGIEASQNKQID